MATIAVVMSSRIAPARSRSVTGNGSPRSIPKARLAAAAADGCDFAVVLEDDVRVGRHLRRD